VVAARGGDGGYVKASKPSDSKKATRPSRGGAGRALWRVGAIYHLCVDSRFALRAVPISSCRTAASGKKSISVDRRLVPDNPNYRKYHLAVVSFAPRQHFSRCQACRRNFNCCQFAPDQAQLPVVRNSGNYRLPGTSARAGLRGWPIPFEIIPGVTLMDSHRRSLEFPSWTE
jgi:hypothetical protein